MSLEQAINDHAAAIRELAAAFVQSQSNSAAALAKLQEAYAAGKDVGKQVRGTLREDASVNQANIEAEQAELEQAVSKVEADAKKNAGAADTATSTGADTAGSAKEPAAADPLDYEKDVKPALIALSVATDKQTMTEYVKSFGVDKAPQLPKEKFAEVIAGAKDRTAKAEAAKAA